ncbi:MAG: SIS domain-containing protein [Anaerolineae bacterium]
MDQLMHEIRQQPEILASLTTKHYAQFERAASAIRARQVSNVLIAARGTSDNAARYAQYLLGHQHRLPVALATPSLYTLYKTPPALKDALVIGISQSGTSPDIIAVIEDARSQGMLTLAITNAADSPLSQAAELVTDCHAGQERSVAATKTYTAQLASIALLSAALGADGSVLATLREIPQAIEQTLAQSDALETVSKRYADLTHAAVIGRGFNYCTAFEIALKVGELAYVAATPYSSADFMHGPIALVEPGYVVLLVAPTGTILPEMQDLAKTLREREADLLVVSDDADTLALASTAMPLPPGIPEWASPLVAVIPGQLLAHHLAFAKGYDPVQPRSLKKVTKTL